MNILLISLGCDKNLVDGEYMLGLLRDKGYTLTDDEEEADVIIVNTCCFIRDAKEESVQTILEMAELKKTGRLQSLIVTGCLSERYREEMKKELPEVDALLGATSYDAIIEAVEESTKGKRVEYYKDGDYLPSFDTRRVNSTIGGHYAYLKIAEGCDKRCTYCVIPNIRGRYRSVPMEILLRQAEELARDGAKELILVAQETTLYGVDLYGRKTLPKLLRELCKIKSLRWIRILYAYPEEITDELIHVIRSEDKVCKYIDVPIQHAADGVLKKMGRRTSKADIASLVGKLRREVPDVVLRTTLITGFPTETREDHEELLDFVRQMKFDHLGVFPYSEEEGTPAVKLAPKVKEKDKERRYGELMQAQQEVVFGEAEKRVGMRTPVLVEGMLTEDALEDGFSFDGGNVYMGRTYMDAPDIDGVLFFESEESYETGDMVEVEITRAKDYDWMGRELGRIEFAE